MKKQKFKIITLCILTIFWGIIIFYFSNMNSYESNGKSKKIIYQVVEITSDIAQKIGILKQTPSENKKQEIVDNLNIPLRKVAHASVYFILAILLLKALVISNNKFKENNILTCIITLLICILYAVSDEFHQTFILGRTSKFSDALIDTLGATIGIIVIEFNYFRKNINFNKFVSCSK